MCARWWCLLHADVIHQVVQRRFNHIHLRQDAKLANLLTVVSRPSSHVILDMVEQRINSIQLRANGGSIVRVFSIMNVLGHLQNLICLCIGFAIAMVVRIVVVQVQAEFVAQIFQARRKVIDVGKAAELNLYGNGCDLRTDRRRLRGVVVAVVSYKIAAMLIGMAGMRNDVT